MQQHNTEHSGWIPDDVSSLRPSESGIALLQRLSKDGLPELTDFASFQTLSFESATNLIRAGQSFDALLLVKSGFLKSVFTDEGGNEQVVNFPVMGDLLGTDGIGNGRYINDVVALSDVEVIRIPFTDLASMQRADPGIIETLFQIISYQLVQEQLALTAIGALCADARVARFLLKVCYQVQSQGCPGQSFHLWMTRQDIGNYLGMKIETVSRTLTHLAALGLITVDQRDVSILDAKGLKGIAYNGSPRQGPLLVRRRKSRTGSGGRDLTRMRVGAGEFRVPSSPWSGLLDLRNTD